MGQKEESTQGTLTKNYGTPRKNNQLKEKVQATRSIFNALDEELIAFIANNEDEEVMESEKSKVHENACIPKINEEENIF